MLHFVKFTFGRLDHLNTPMCDVDSITVVADKIMDVEQLSKVDPNNIQVTSTDYFSSGFIKDS